MPNWMPAVLKLVLALAALVAMPVYTWLQGHEVPNALLGFLAALIALFMNPPGAKPDVDL